FRERRKSQRIAQGNREAGNNCGCDFVAAIAWNENGHIVAHLGKRFGKSFHNVRQPARFRIGARLGGNEEDFHRVFIVLKNGSGTTELRQARRPRDFRRIIATLAAPWHDSEWASTSCAILAGANESSRRSLPRCPAIIAARGSKSAPGTGK